MPDLPYLASGIAFGLASGLAPGPTTTLVVSQTLRHGVREGLKVALAPLMTDAPIIFAALLLVSRLAEMRFALGAIALAGALFLACLGVEGLRTRPASREIGDAVPRSLLRGVLANLFNPHPWLFWATVGAPLVLRALEASPLSAAIFIGSLYVFLVGAKMGIAVLVGRGRGFLSSRGYVVLSRILGGIMLLFAALFVRDGLRYLNLVQ